MAALHFLNVRQGDCIVIQHASDRITVFDICSGNLPEPTLLERLLQAPATGNLRMCEHPTQPIEYIKRLTRAPVWRFILSHPDMDHLDGFSALMTQIGITNFWSTGVVRPKPDFRDSPYNEADWDRYVRVRDRGEAGVTVLTPRAGSRFQFANRPEGGHDGLYILAPSEELLQKANQSGRFNDGGLVLLYRSVGGKIVIPGDAEDPTWDYILDNYADDIEDCSLLVAPHHGRKAGQSFKFLDVMRPKLTLFGCAPSEDLAYDAWRNRGLQYVTNNQAGCVVAELHDGQMDISVESVSFARALLSTTPTTTNAQGFYFIGTIS